MGKMEYRARVTCKQCQGEGVHDVDVDIDSVMRIVDTIGMDRKLVCIMQVRTETQLGLKQAKDLVEATMNFMKQMEVNNDITRSS